jgi:hypothetical protein
MIGKSDWRGDANNEICRGLGDLRNISELTMFLK